MEVGDAALGLACLHGCAVWRERVDLRMGVLDEHDGRRLPVPFFLGQDGTGKYPAAFNGDIDDFALWTRSLSYEDVRKIYEAGRNGIPLGDLL